VAPYCLLPVAVLAACLYWAEAQPAEPATWQLQSLFSRIRFPAIRPALLLCYYPTSSALRRFDNNKELLMRAVSSVLAHWPTWHHSSLPM